MERKEKILRNARKLRSEVGKFKRIFLHQDLTVKERLARKKLVEELKQRKEDGEEGLIIINGRIVKKGQHKWSAKDDPPEDPPEGT